MTDSKDSGSQKPARSTARQGEQSVRIPRLQAGGPQKPGRPDAKVDSTKDETLESAPEVVEVEETDVEREEKAAAAAPAKGRPTPAKRTPAKKTSTTASSRTSGSQKVSARDEPKKPGGAARSGGAMTAADYARTTRESADSTSIIPAIRDEDPQQKQAKGKKSSVRVEPAASSTAASATPAPGSGRRAELRLVHVEPWSVTKLAFVVSVALMIVSVVAVAIFWVVLDLTGVWDQLNGSVTNVLSDNSDSFDITSVLGLPRLVGLTLVLSAINVVVMTALATIAAHLYNLAAQLLGGIHLTFSDD